MPKIGNLQNCKIYKITSLNNPNMVYYGHTCQTLAQRFTTHKTASNKSTSKNIIAMGDAVILLVENFPCSSEDEAKAREAFYIQNNECVNRNIPGRNQKDSYKNWYNNHYEEYYEANKEHYKEYYEANKEHYKEHYKEYYKNNKEKIKQYQKNNREKINIQQRERRKLKKEQQNLTTTI
jgi:hypothetical protein